MTINTIVCFFVLVQAETTPDVKVLVVRNFRTQKRIQKFLTRCVGPLLHTENISHHYYHLFNSVKRRARISFWKLFSFASVYIKKKIRMLTRILAVFELYRGLWGAHFFLFYITGGFCALAMGLQRYIKAILVQLYICVGPYEIRFNFSQI